MNARISIIVPVYNRSEIVTRTLDSLGVQADSTTPVNLIVVDNNSTDDTPEVLRRWKEANESNVLRITLLHEDTPGAAAARQCGLDAVNTEYVVFFDSDDLMRPDTIASYLKAFNDNPSADIVRGRTICHGDGGKSRFTRSKTRNLLYDHFHHCILNTIVYAVRTEFIRKCGGWNPTLRIWDDWELGLRLLLNNPRVIAMKHIVADIFEQENSVTGDSYSDRKSRYAAPLRAVEDDIVRSSRKDKRRLLRMVMYRRMMLAALYRREGERQLSQQVYREVMSLCVADRRMRLLLPVVYHYIAAGGRGCATLVTPFL